MTYAHIRIDHKEHIDWIVLNRPDRANAMSNAMLEEFSTALESLKDTAAPVIGIRGEGKGFCSGGDMASNVPEGMGFGDMIAKGLIDAVNPMLRKLAAELHLPLVDVRAAYPDFAAKHQTTIDGLLLDASADLDGAVLSGTSAVDVVAHLLESSALPLKSSLNFSDQLPGTPVRPFFRNGFGPARRMAVGS